MVTTTQRDSVHTNNQRPATPLRERFGGQASNRSGFTLIELLIVISLIMILAGIAMVQYRNSVLHGKEVVLQTNLLRMRDAVDQYYADKGRYPASLDALVSERYLRDVPVDPLTGRADTWVTEAAPPDPSNQSGGPGIYNIRSGFDGTAINGTRYSTW